jgi:hypothetical protein
MSSRSPCAIIWRLIFFSTQSLMAFLVFLVFLCIAVKEGIFGTAACLYQYEAARALITGKRDDGQEHEAIEKRTDQPRGVPDMGAPDRSRT